MKELYLLAWSKKKRVFLEYFFQEIETRYLKNYFNILFVTLYKRETCVMTK